MVTGFHQAVAHNEVLDDFMVGYRNRAWSAKAWHAHKHAFCNKHHQKDFCAGFRQGYEDVAAGGNGCTPAIAPQAYWGWQYQSPEGQAKVNSWFEAYPLGARAAEEQGLGNWGHIRTMLPAHQVMPLAVVPECEPPLGNEPTLLETEVFEPLPVTPLPVTPLPVTPLQVTPVPVVPVPVVPVPVTPLTGKVTAPRGAGGEGMIDFSAITKVPASSVPTAATGR